MLTETSFMGNVKTSILLMGKITMCRKRRV